MAYHVESFSGSRREVGRALGRFYRRHGPALFRPVPEGAISCRQVEFARRQADLIGDHAPGLIEEIQGLAEELCRDYGRTLAICLTNALPQGEEVASGGGSSLSAGRGPSAPTGCSTFAWHDEDGAVLVGRNLDFPPAERTYLARYTTPTGVSATFGVTDNLIGYLDGLNEHGLAVTMAVVMGPAAYDMSLVLPRRTPGAGIIFSVLIRAALETCRTTAEAVRFLTGMPHLEAFNFLVADRSGDLRVVEASPGRCNVRCGSLAIAATNYFSSAEMIGTHRDIDPENWPTQFSSCQERERLMVLARDIGA